MSSKVALIIVDMLKVFFEQTEKLPAAKNQSKVAQNIKILLDECRNRKIPVIYSNDAFNPAEAPIEPHFKIFGVHGIKGDPSSGVIDLLTPTQNDFVIEKRMYDGFYETRLDSVLRQLKVDTVIVTGTWTNGCVKHTVMGAWARSYCPIVVKDAVTCPDENEHNWALKYMEKFYQAKIVNVSEALDVIKSTKSTP
jgi:nicotinamidase-related amidase